MKGEGSMNYELDMPPYVDQMADWLEGLRRRTEVTDLYVVAK